MTGSFLSPRRRRLPVFFLLDTSKAMIGTFEVTMQQGLFVVKHELSQHAIASQCVHLGIVTFGEKAAFHRLVPADFFTPPTWTARGDCILKPALVSLTDAFKFDLIATRPDHPGDYAPLVFLILGERPTDAWQGTYKSISSFTDNRRPLIVSLVTRTDLASEMKAISHHVLLLKPAEAVHMTSFFFWAAQAIAKISEDCEQGASAIDFPLLPYGVVVPR